jgi:hypothetical protein
LTGWQYAIIIRGMDTVEAVIEALGGDSVVGQVCQVPRNTVTYWRIRDRVPPEHWEALARLAKARQVDGVDHTLFTRLWRPRKRRSTNAGAAA